MTLSGDPGEAALLVRAVRGDEQAFAQLVTRHKASLYGYIRRFVGNAEDAQDLLQQTFLSAWLAIERFDPERPPGAWLRTIARNKCRDHGRKALGRRLLKFADWGRAAEQVVDTRATPEERWIDDEGLGAVDRAVASLPRALKEPLLLTAFEGLSQAEAAQELGISVKSVETRLYRARRRLADTLKLEGH
ncbi:MAG: polymerase sigma-70 factor,ECF subfamily [Sphingomonas bacterium]|uniref:RNA polymerase sigma factor n=1 Tax=Sphingomonas bacterium TaxID=1895847 RepID=UPI002631D7A3|nr:RNA polymerase sigma factor [Sphingomonas bacterium]MDB5696211.1 polymerase sigma-70 factor,ECF subfamily [Sphingomonas bacterium]